MSETTYTTYGEHSIQQNVTVKEIHLPFVIYNKTVTEDPETGKKKVDKSFKVKDQNGIITDAIILGVSATTINAIGNGLAHFIYACKKPKTSKKNK